MKIIIETIPHAEQRYNTIGDWYKVTEPSDWQEYNGSKDDPIIMIRVSKELGNDNLALLVAIHELIEMKLCEADGITQEAVDKFDLGEGKDLSEPGESKDAPYHLQHEFAETIERQLALRLGIDWYAYCERIAIIGE